MEPKDGPVFSETELGLGEGKGVIEEYTCVECGRLIRWPVFRLRCDECLEYEAKNG